MAGELGELVQFTLLMEMIVANVAARSDRLDHMVASIQSHHGEQVIVLILLTVLTHSQSKGF